MPPKVKTVSWEFIFQPPLKFLSTFFNYFVKLKEEKNKNAKLSTEDNILFQYCKKRLELAEPMQFSGISNP